MDDAEFETVLSAAQAGAPWACGRIYEGLKRPVLAYVALRGIRDADDVTSEVFLHVFRDLNGFVVGSEADFRAWVFTIARRRVQDAWRGRARRVPETALTSELDPSAGDVAEDALSRLGLVPYASALAGLTADQRDVVLLRVVGDQSLEQVAATLGRSVASVKALQHRALRALRRALEASPESFCLPPAILDPR